MEKVQIRLILLILYHKNGINQMDHLLVVEEFSPQSKSDPPAGRQRGRGEAEATVGRMEQGHTAGPLETTDTAALTLQLHQHLEGKTK